MPRMTASFVPLGLVLLLVPFAFGCQLTPNFDVGYRVDPHRVGRGPVPATLAVTPLDEGRQQRHYETSGRIFLLYLPLVPYSSTRLERVDESVRKISDEKRKSGLSAVALVGRDIARSTTTRRARSCGSRALP